MVTSPAPAQFPRFKRGWGGDKEETILGQGVECKCETDIFEVRQVLLAEQEYQ